MKSSTLHPVKPKRFKRINVFVEVVSFFAKAKWLWLLLLVLLVIWFLLFKTDLFLIKNIKFISNNEKFDLNISNNVSYDQPFINKRFFAFNPSNYTEELKKSSPFIKRVYIEKKFPNTVVIYVYYYSVDYLIYERDDCFLASDLDYVFFRDKGHKCDVWANDSTLRIINQEEGFSIEKNPESFEDFFKIKKIFTFAGWDIKEIDIKKQKYFVHVGDKKVFIIDMTESLDDQLKKLLILTDTIVNYNYGSFKVFLGYEKPFLEKY